MSQEIEMKLALDETGPQCLLQHPLLRNDAGRLLHLANTYFDTPNGELEGARMALRLRRRDNRWLQTLKTSGEGSGGYSRRREWEWPVADGQLDLARLAELPPIAELGADVLSRLAPRFATDFTRRLWQLELADASVEVALDQGEIRAGGHRVAICELELELKDGSPRALWSLAQAFAETVPLRPADASKAVRGGALLSGAWTLPQGDGAQTQLHRALLALDAFADTGEIDWQAQAVAAFQTLGANGEADAQRLASMLQQPDWLNTDFGRTALRLAQRLSA